MKRPVKATHKKRSLLLTDKTGLNSLIYNPDLPEGWEDLDKTEDKTEITLMFHKLFLLLNEDYQKECGEEIYGWVSQDAGNAERQCLSTKNSERSNLPKELGMEEYKLTVDEGIVSASDEQGRLIIWEHWRENELEIWEFMGSAEFALCEFENQGKDVSILCEAIKKDYYCDILRVDILKKEPKLCEVIKKHQPTLYGKIRKNVPILCEPVKGTLLCDLIKEGQERCGGLKRESDCEGGITMPRRYTIYWLNRMLQLTNYYDQLIAVKPNLNLTDDIKKLEALTVSNRKRPFKDLKGDEQRAIKMLNRFMIELAYEEKTPKKKKIRIFTREEAEAFFSKMRCCRDYFLYGMCHDCKKLFRPIELCDILFRKKVKEYKRCNRRATDPNNSSGGLTHVVKTDDRTILVYKRDSSERDRYVYEPLKSAKAEILEFEELDNIEEMQEEMGADFNPEIVFGVYGVNCYMREMDNFENYYLKRQYDKELPREIYTVVEIYRPKEELLKDFEKLIDEIQPRFFEEHSEMRNPDTGFVKEDSKGRKIKVDFENIARFFQVYVRLKLGETRSEIATADYPRYVAENPKLLKHRRKHYMELLAQDEDHKMEPLTQDKDRNMYLLTNYYESNMELLNADIRRAKDLIKSARTADFLKDY